MENEGLNAYIIKPDTHWSSASQSSPRSLGMWRSHPIPPFRARSDGYGHRRCIFPGCISQGISLCRCRVHLGMKPPAVCNKAVRLRIYRGRRSYRIWLRWWPDEREEQSWKLRILRIGMLCIFHGQVCESIRIGRRWSKRPRLGMIWTSRRWRLLVGSTWSSIRVERHCQQSGDWRLHSRSGSWSCRFLL